MTYRSATLAAFLAALITAAPAISLAQDTKADDTKEATESEAKEADKDGAEAEKKEPETPMMAVEDLKKETVLLTINGKDITLGEVIAIRQSLPEQYQNLPDEILLGALVQQLADQQMLADAAEKAGLCSPFALLRRQVAQVADARRIGGHRPYDQLGCWRFLLHGPRP